MNSVVIAAQEDNERLAVINEELKSKIQELK